MESNGNGTTGADASPYETKRLLWDKAKRLEPIATDGIGRDWIGTECTRSEGTESDVIGWDCIGTDTSRSERSRWDASAKRAVVGQL